LFTGLIEDIGRVKILSGSSLTIQTDISGSVARGDSLAVDGSCLTVDGIAGGGISFHCSPETISRTIVSRYHPGSKVNLEQPLKLSDGLHGHLVTGHIDETAAVLKVERTGEGMMVWISCSRRHYSRENHPLLVSKGSIAVSGISLTIASLDPGRFAVALIPETLKGTTAGNWKPGTLVNLEYDIIGKYVQKQTDAAIGKIRLREYLEQ